MDQTTVPRGAISGRKAVFASCIVLSVLLQPLLLAFGPTELPNRFLALPAAFVVATVVVASLLSAAIMVELYWRGIAPMFGNVEWLGSKHFSIVMVVSASLLPFQIWFALTAGRSPL